MDRDSPRHTGAGTGSGTGTGTGTGSGGVGRNVEDGEVPADHEPRRRLKTDHGISPTPTTDTTTATVKKDEYDPTELQELQAFKQEEEDDEEDDEDEDTRLQRERKRRREEILAKHARARSESGASSAATTLTGTGTGIGTAESVVDAQTGPTVAPQSPSGNQAQAQAQAQALSPTCSSVASLGTLDTQVSLGLLSQNSATSGASSKIAESPSRPLSALVLNTAGPGATDEARSRRGKSIDAESGIPTVQEPLSDEEE